MICRRAFPVVIYNACETWILRETDEKRITAFANQCGRLIFRIPWTDHRTNADIRKELDVQEN